MVAAGALSKRNQDESQETGSPVRVRSALLVNLVARDSNSTASVRAVSFLSVERLTMRDPYLTSRVCTAISCACHLARSLAPPQPQHTPCLPRALFTSSRPDPVRARPHHPIPCAPGPAWAPSPQRYVATNSTLYTAHAHRSFSS